MTIYLASPNTQQQAEHACGMPVLFSFAHYAKWLDRYQASFRRILIDSGAYSELNSAKKIDWAAYKDWAARWKNHADAIAGLDDISGDWRRSLRNYEDFGGFPTFHDTDPPELLGDLIPLAKERGNWIGLGLKPPREGKAQWVRNACRRIPDGIHIHGWALRSYTHVRRLDSADSTEWWRTAMAVRQRLPWLTYGEALEIVIKKYVRWERGIETESGQLSMFDGDN